MKAAGLVSVLAACVVGGLLPAGAQAQAAPGDLAQKQGRAGCITSSAGSGPCAEGGALGNGYTSVEVSPDGRSAYVASGYLLRAPRNSGAVAVFDRAPNGRLTQKRGSAGCISETGAGRCADGRALEAASEVTVSPDGRSVYVVSGAGVAVFDRAPSGKLTQKRGRAGCVTETGTGGCADGKALVGASDVTVSPDGGSAYVTVALGGQAPGGAISVFDRARDGTLTQKRGLAGCIADDQSPAARSCTDGRIGLPSSVALSPDGQSVYTSSGVVAVLDRAADGTLTQKPGTAGCISETGDRGCADGTALEGQLSLAVSPDGRSAYVASQISGAVAVLDRAADGTLTQKPGTAGCTSETGADGCADGMALERASSVTVTPDGRSAYVKSQRPLGVERGSDRVALLDRAADGTLTQKPGPAGCISGGHGGDGCERGRAIQGARALAVSPDGQSVYAASVGRDGARGGAIAVFDRGKQRPTLAQPGVEARQKRRRVIVRVTGHLLKAPESPCSGRVAVGARSGGRRARQVLRVQKGDEGRCTYRTVFRFRVRKLKRPVRPRHSRLLVQVNSSYMGSGQLQGDRASSVLERVRRR